MIMIYKKAWISKYFNVDVKSEEGIVFLYDNSPTKKTILVSDRFEVLLEIPDVSKQFFQPNPFWNDISSSWIESSMLSDIQGGFQSYNARGTKTEIYSPPFFIVFKMPGISSNYLSFIDYQKTNSETTILCMLQHDEEKNGFRAEYSPELFLLYNKDLCLSEILEFTMHDSKNQLVRVSDKSQLFIALTLL